MDMYLYMFLNDAGCVMCRGPVVCFLTPKKPIPHSFKSMILSGIIFDKSRGQVIRIRGSTVIIVELQISSQVS